MAKLRTAQAARDDIGEIRRFSKARFGGSKAAEYLEGLSAMFDLIAERPLAGVDERGLGVDLRSFRYRSHRIYYRVRDDGVLVVRILHQARDVQATFESSQ